MQVVAPLRSVAVHVKRPIAVRQLHAHGPQVRLAVVEIPRIPAEQFHGFPESVTAGRLGTTQELPFLIGRQSIAGA
jgi:hypothetical protein